MFFLHIVMHIRTSMKRMIKIKEKQQQKTTGDLVVFKSNQMMADLRACSRF